jgi:hypothetical protein
MRVLRLVALCALACAGCHYGGFVSGGGGWHHPSLDDTHNAIPGLPGDDWSAAGGLLYSAAGGIGIADNPSCWTGVEGWAGYSDAMDLGDLVVPSLSIDQDLEAELLMVGLGLRLVYGEDRRAYGRVGVTYEEMSDGDFVGDVSASWGGYIGFGYQFYLDEGCHISIAPEFLLHLQDRDFQGTKDETGTPRTVLAGTGAVVLTYHFGGSDRIEAKRKAQRKADREYEGLPPLRDDLK